MLCIGTEVFFSFFLGLRRVWFHHRGMDDLSSCLFWGVWYMDHSCHVFRSGSPGGTLRPPLPFFQVWAHRVGPFGPPSHFFWCGRTLWRAMRVVPFLSAMDASKVIPEKPIEHPHNTRRRPADVAAFQCPHNTRRHPADVAVYRCPELTLMHPRPTYYGFLRRRAGVVSGDTVNAPWGYRTGTSRHAVTPTPLRRVANGLVALNLSPCHL